MATSDVTMRLRLDSDEFVRDVRRVKRQARRPHGWMDWVLAIGGATLIVFALIGGPIAHDWGRAVFDLVLGIWLMNRAES